MDCVDDTTMTSGSEKTNMNLPIDISVDPFYIQLMTFINLLGQILGLGSLLA